MKYSTNTTNIQIRVEGWKRVQNGTMHNSSGTYEVYANGNGIGYLNVYGSATIQGSGKETEMFTISNPYKPIGLYVNQVNSKSDSQIITIWSGIFTIYNVANVGTTTVEYSSLFRY